MLELEQALQRILSVIRPLGFETVMLHESQGRFAAQPALSPVDLPLFDNSAMDGYAVRAANLSDASSGNPVSLRLIGEVPAGEMFQADLLKPGAFQRIKYSFLRSGPRNLICRAAAEPDGYAEEIGWRLVVMIGGA